MKNVFESFIMEENNKKYDLHAKNFISNVLKLGTKENIFDEYLKKQGLNTTDLSLFVNAVINELEKWR